MNIHARSAATVLLWAVAITALSAQAEPLSPLDRCRQLLEPAGFDNRFGPLRVIVRVAGCNLRGLVTDKAMQEVVAPRIRLYANACFDEQDRAYLQQSFRRGAMREAAGANLERCSVAFERVNALRLPPATR